MIKFFMANSNYLFIHVSRDINIKKENLYSIRDDIHQQQVANSIAKRNNLLVAKNC